MTGVIAFFDSIIFLIHMNDNNWKLKLQNGKIKTQYKHYTIIANGTAKDVDIDFNCVDGNAFMGMKVWASSEEEAADMIKLLGKQIGFTVTGNIEIYNSEPLDPPKENPFGYDIRFTPY
ncbi:MAG TPA: hypothetical protein VFV46_06395 [Lacibacter sp.]|nr:hypothetical protein [Lacibacter sp.]